MDQLRKTEYGKVLHEKSAESLIDTELELDRYLIKKSFLYTHQYPMSVMSILTYMMNKIIEVRNLKSIARAKQLGIEEKYIEEKLIVM
jgi:vacuolar-type H+-ATPase subunit C/Vma6